MVEATIVKGEKNMEYICIYVGAATIAWCFMKLLGVLEK